MNKEDVIRMAREAGLKIDLNDGTTAFFWYPEIERFAALVAAAEREECAKVCQAFWQVDGQLTADEFAAEVRARSKS